MCKVHVNYTDKVKVHRYIGQECCGPKSLKCKVNDTCTDKVEVHRYIGQESCGPKWLTYTRSTTDHSPNY